MYEDIYDAKQACTHLSGFNVKGRSVRLRCRPVRCAPLTVASRSARSYIIVLYHQPEKAAKKLDAKKQLETLAGLREKYNVKPE